jgi:hypothetical protein
MNYLSRLPHDLESLRHAYKPARVRWLFIGESPPANGTFFYKADSNLSRYTQQAFSIALERKFADGKEFLDSFKAQGCYLIDLCDHPINHLPESEREEQRRRGATSLPERIAEHLPQASIVVMKAIAKYVQPAIGQAGLADLPCYVLPFPAMGNQKRYVERLVAVLRELNITTLSS